MAPMRGQRGFTLLELVVVMVLAAILFLGGADLIVGPMRNFSESEARQGLYEEGKLALERIRAELYQAVPNAIQVSADNSTLTFGTIDTDYMRSRGLFGQYRLDRHPGDNEITDVNGTTAEVGRVLSIYNVNWDSFASGRRLYRVTGLDGSAMELDRRVPPGGYHRRSRRYYVAGDTVRFQFSGSILYRSHAPTTKDGPGTFSTPYPLATHVEEGRFRFIPGNSKRNGVVVVRMTLEDQAGEQVRFLEEIHVPNVP